MRIYGKLRLKGKAFNKVYYSATFLLLILSIISYGCTNSSRYKTVEKPFDSYMKSVLPSAGFPDYINRMFDAQAVQIKDDSMSVSAPYSEVVYFSADDPHAISFRVKGEEGQKLIVDIVEPQNQLVAMNVEVYEVPQSKRQKPSAEPVAEALSPLSNLEYEFESNNYYIVRLRPDVLKSGEFTVNIQSKPVLKFPINGLTSDFVSSGWGDPRDSGKRKHEGVDIMSPMGTPVVSASQGYVSFVGWNNLGGNVVSVVDLKRGLSFYYAHLSRQIAKVGQRVEIGDTLGLVGNTGDAITTPPHLHFGIYTFSYGAIDPMPYLKKEGLTTPLANASLAMLGKTVKPKSKTAALMKEPSFSSRVISRLNQTDAVVVTGVGSKWLRVSLADGKTAFLALNSVVLVDSPVKTNSIRPENRNFTYFNLKGRNSDNNLFSSSYLTIAGETGS